MAKPSKPTNEPKNDALVEDADNQVCVEEECAVDEVVANPDDVQFDADVQDPETDDVNRTVEDDIEAFEDVADPMFDDVPAAGVVEEASLDAREGAEEAVDTEAVEVFDNLSEPIFEDTDDEVEAKVKRGSHVQATIDERMQLEAEAEAEAQAQEAYVPDEPIIEEQVQIVSPEQNQASKKSADKHHSHLKKSRRVRTALIVVIVLLLLAFGGLVFMFVNSLSEVNAHMENETQRVSSSEQMESTADQASAGKVNAKVVPQITKVIGKTQDEALPLIGHGAVVTKSTDIVEKTKEEDSEGNETEKEEVVGTKVTVSLTEGPTDSQGNVPVVYLKLDKDGYTTQVGFSSSLMSLGVDDCSFSDAIEAKNVVGDVLGASGVHTEKSTLVLPKDKSEYRTMDAEGKNISEERFMFEGEVDIDGTATPWTCTLIYDYSAKNVSGNLNDTIKLIYVYIGA